MGKRLITQRRGRGTSTYRAPSHRYISQIKHRKYDQKEKNVNYGRIIDLVHCPGHSAPLARVRYEDGEQVYMAAPEKVAVNDIIASGIEAPVQDGNTLPLNKIPEGMSIYNIEKNPGDGGKFCRSSGAFAKIVTKFSNKIVIKFPSKEQKSFNPECRATIGIVAGSGRTEKPFVKAGNRFYAMKARNKLYPRTSGVSMNSVDHPFGSGRGSHMGKPATPPRNASPGRNIGLIRASRTGRRKKK
ncbi:50S ribosomal protein L2 [archaeon]|nr:50S ribosomal protein L2 [archaeon]|tara:strand:+ start:1801 stop:2529 length:729 start_codon:yes stop_codon:yes gene_type:complete